MKEILTLSLICKRVKPVLFKTATAILAISLMLFFTGCAKSDTNNEDPLNKPFSIGPTSAPNVEIPNSNPPINE